MTTKEFDHPFYKVVLSYDETKTETDYEKELLKKYLNFLDDLYSKQESIKNLRNRYYQSQLLHDEATPELEKMHATLAALSKRGLEFRDGLNNDAEEFSETRNQFISLYNDYTNYDQDILTPFCNLTNQLQKDFDELFDWFENEGSENSFAPFDDFAHELYKHYENYSLDLSSFDESVDNMKGSAWKNLDAQWEDFYSVRETLVKEANKYVERVREFTVVAKSLDDVLNDLFEGKFKPRHVQVDILLSRCIQFRLLSDAETTDDANEFALRFRVDYDLDKLADDLWIFNMDNYIQAEDEMFLQVRNSFKVPMTLKEITRMETLTFLVDLGFKNALMCAGDMYKERNRKPDWSKVKVPQESMDFVVKHLFESISEFDEEEYDRHGYFRRCTELNATTVIRGTPFIINEVLFNNPEFNWDQNQRAFGEIVPIATYTTLYCIIDKTMEQPQPINIRQLLGFMLCVECASQLLTGDHLPALESRLNKFKFDETVRAQYLKEAQSFIADMLAEFKKVDSKFIDMEEDYRDWNSIIT